MRSKTFTKVKNLFQIAFKNTFTSPKYQNTKYIYIDQNLVFNIKIFQNMDDLSTKWLKAQLQALIWLCQNTC